MLFFQSFRIKEYFKLCHLLNISFYANGAFKFKRWHNLKNVVKSYEAVKFTDLYNFLIKFHLKNLISTKLLSFVYV